MQIYKQNTFTSRQRILKSRDFKSIAQISRNSSNLAEKTVTKYHSTFFVVFVKQINPSLQKSARLGITVSKKVNKRALIRNSIKRHIRESFRVHPIRLQALDIIIIAKPNKIDDLKYIQKDCNCLFERILKVKIPC